MTEARWLTGDVFARLADIDDGSIDLVCTSPPFWRQRAYLPNDHPLKPFEIGQEATPGEFIDVLLRLTAEFRRVLAPHGTIAVELADTMAGSGGAGGDYDPGGLREGQPKFDGSSYKQRRRPDPTGNGWGPLPDMHKGGNPKVADVRAKSHCMIPEAYRFALAYGINPLTGEPSPAGKWIVRNTVDWCRRNPTPGDDGDKFRRATSDIAIATLNPRRYWDGDSVRVTASLTSPGNRYPRERSLADVERGKAAGTTDRTDNRMTGRYDPTAGDGTRPLYDWWDLSSDPYPGAHYAVWPPEVARRLILSMCPERVCIVCGRPSRRIVDVKPTPVSEDQRTELRLSGRAGLSAGPRPNRDARTLGWTDCGCIHPDARHCPTTDDVIGPDGGPPPSHWRPGHVLDPFGGSGTTGAVATGNSRNATLIDLDDRNLNLARNRIGMFLTEESVS